MSPLEHRVRSLGVLVPLTCMMAGLTLGYFYCRATQLAEVLPREIERGGAELSDGFTWISSVRELADGRVLLTDVLERRIVVGDFGTGYTEDVAKVGSGPGEFRQLGLLWSLGGDSTAMVDRSGGRWLLFNGSKVVSTLGPETPIVQATLKTRIVGMDHAGTVVGLVYQSRSARRDSLLVVRYNRDTAKADTIGRIQDVVLGVTYEAAPPSTPNGGAKRYHISIVSRDQIAVFPDGYIALARVRPYRVDWCTERYRCERGERLIRKPRRLNDGDQTAILTAYNAQAVWPPTQRLEETTGWPDELPPFALPVPVPNGTATLMLADGRLVIHRLPRGEVQGTLYDVIDREGQIVESLLLPFNERLVGAGLDAIYIAATDRVGVQRLRKVPFVAKQTVSQQGIPNSRLRSRSPTKGRD